jgi:hypothetical protein
VSTANYQQEGIAAALPCFLVTMEKEKEKERRCGSDIEVTWVYKLHNQ